MTIEVDDDRYPARTGVYIEATWYGYGKYTGSGVLVGRNDILTAAHVIYDVAKGGIADDIKLYTPYDPDDIYNTTVEWSRVAYYPDFDPDGDGRLFPGDFKSGTLGETERDIALFTLTEAAGDTYGWMGLDLDFRGGPVGVLGHPGVYNNQPSYDEGSVVTAPYNDHALIYNRDLEVNPGNSGGAIFYDYGNGPYVVGIVSTGIAAVNVSGHPWLLDYIADNDGAIGAPLNPPTGDPLADLSTLINATDQNLSQFKGLTAAYSVLGGVPSIDGYRFLINRNNETNFGAGRDGPVFNDENIYINTVNALYQGNATARANADALLSTVETLNDRLSLIYDHIIPQDARSDEGRAHFLSQAEFYAARAAELGIEGPNGAAVVAFASLMKIAVDADIDGFGGSINDLVEAVGNGTAAIPVSGSNLTPIGTAIGGAPVGPVSLTSGTDAADGAGDGIDFASLNLPRVDDGNTHGGIDGPNTLVAEERANGSDVSNYVYSSMSEVPELGATGETDTAILSVISDDDGPNFVHGIGPEVEDMAWTDFI